MRLGILFLVFGYFLSQFYRSFLAVLTPILSADIGASASDLSFASGLWFFVFALMQIPVGWALDRFGPRVTTSVLLALGGGGGAVVFAMASGPNAVSVAMVLFGIGSSPVLMASYYIFARMYPPAMFATLGGAMIGFGSAGNLAGSAPLGWAVDTYGWRATLWGLAVAAVVVATALLLALRDPPKAPSEAHESGSLLDLLRNRNLLFIFPLMLVNYAPAAGISGLWAGPYLADVYGLDQTGIGRATLMMAIAMAIGSFAYGPMERLVGSKKKVVLAGNLCGAVLCLFLWAVPQSTWMTSAIAITAIGFFGASFPVLMAHAQQFLPRHMTGRGITLLNLFGIGGVAIMQFVTSAMAKTQPAGVPAAPDFYGSLFLLFGLGLLLGALIYSFSSEKPPV